MKNYEDDFDIPAEISYDFRTETLTLINPGLLPMHAFVIGESLKQSEKSKGQELIGKYGEGLKIAIIVLLRNKNKLTITNYEKEKRCTWYFFTKQNEQTENIECIQY